ncbi:MAG: 50S ribosomal protein L24 [Pyrinomonadaceae bacterium]|jgi:large subunit ribosomal protein L24
MAQQGVKRVKIRKGDQVVVIAGRDNGKRGRVLEVEPQRGKVKVEGVAMAKKHQKANPGANRGGGIIDREAFIDISNVQLIDPQTGAPTRVRYEVDGDTKRRVAAKSGQSLEK